MGGIMHQEYLGKCVYVLESVHFPKSHTGNKQRKTYL